ncbi:MAG: long-chain-fatty-acid--CoA ligase [Actinomycetota bacterium]
MGDRDLVVKELVYHRQLIPSVARNATKTAMIDGPYRATFEQHFERVCRLANALGSELGVKRDDRVGILALNSHAFVELYQACFMGGGIINGLNIRLAPKELEFILQDSGSKVVLTDAMFAGVIEQIRPNLPDLEKVVLIGEGDAAHDVRYEDLVAAGSTDIPPETEESDPVILNYTGGTTGLPKGVLIDQRAGTLHNYRVFLAIDIDKDEIYLNQTPMFHGASVFSVVGTATVGGTLASIPAFDPKVVMDAIETHQVTGTTMVPTMIGMTFSHPDFDPSRFASLRLLAYGASPMPEALLTKVMELLPQVELYQAYGMTEATAVTTVLTPEDHRRGGTLLRSAGRAVPGVQITIQDPQGKILPSGEVGEVCMTSGSYLREYWKRPEETAQTFRGGWYHSGDAGYLDEEGYLFLVDRVKDMIVSGGENIYTSEVENAISKHPAVLQVAVFGIPSERWGEAVHAVIVLHETATATEDEIIAHTRDWIAGYKVPRSVEFRAEPLPLSGAMKVLKRDLRAPYWEGKERKVN